MKAVKMSFAILLVAFVVSFVNISPGNAHFAQLGAAKVHASNWELVDSATDSWLDGYGSFGFGADRGYMIGFSGFMRYPIEPNFTYKIEYYLNRVYKYSLTENDPAIVVDVSIGSIVELKLYRALKNKDPSVSISSPSPNGTLLPSFNRAERGA